MRHWLARPIQIGFCAWLALQGAPVLGQGALKPIQIDPSIAQRERTVHLEVHINGQPTSQNIALNYNPVTGKLSTRRSELEEAGVRVPGSGAANDIVVIDQLGYPARYDEARQQLHFTLSDEQRIPRNYGLRGTMRAPEATADPGFLLNYSLYGASFKDSNSRLQFSGGNASFDARAFSKFGVFSQTAIVGSTLYREGANVLRLDPSTRFRIRARRSRRAQATSFPTV